MKKPADIIRELREQCSIAHLAFHIDAPIDARLATFTQKCCRVRSPRQLCAVVLKLLRHLDAERYAGTLGLMEAARLVEAVTKPEGGIGGAFPSIKEGTQGGLYGLLARVVACIKQERRHLYVRGLLRQSIDPSDGEQRLLLAQAFLAQCAPLFLQGAPTAERIANRLEDLVLDISQTSYQLNRTFAA